jgi:hypothetical protein
VGDVDIRSVEILGYSEGQTASGLGAGEVLRTWTHYEGQSILCSVAHQWILREGGMYAEASLVESLGRCILVLIV